MNLRNYDDGDDGDDGDNASVLYFVNASSRENAIIQKCKHWQMDILKQANLCE